MRTLRRLALAGLVTLAGCDAITGSDAADRELARAEVRWLRLGLDDYTYRLTYDCYCPGAGREMIVTVVNDRVQRVTDAESGRVFTDVDVSAPTIEKLFQQIEDAYHEGTRVDARYNPRSGYPEVATLGDLAADAGTRFAVRDVQPTPYVSN